MRGFGASHLYEQRDARARLRAETIVNGTAEWTWRLHCFDLRRNSRPLSIGNGQFCRFFLVFTVFIFFSCAKSTVFGTESSNTPEFQEFLNNARDDSAVAACAGIAERSGMTLTLKTKRRTVELRDVPDLHFPSDRAPIPWLSLYRLVECNYEKEYYVVLFYNYGDPDYLLVDWHSGREMSLTSNNWYFRSDGRSFVVVNHTDRGFEASVQYVERDVSEGWRLVWRYFTDASEQEFIGWAGDDEFLVRIVIYPIYDSPHRDWIMRFRILPVGFMAVNE